MISQDLYPPPHKSWKQIASRLPPDKLDEFMDSFKDMEADILNLDFAINARREQLPPSWTCGIYG